MVPKKGLEPPHPCGYMDLNHARLPIPPLRQVTFLCGAAHGRLEGRDYDIYSYKAGSECQTTTHWFVPATAPQDLWPKFNCRRTTVPSKSSAKSKSAKPD